VSGKSQSHEAELPPELRDLLPASTATMWVKLAPLVPASAYLAGGTGLTVHLHHRLSRDLDFMLAEDEDLEALRMELRRVGRVVVTRQDLGTLSCVVDGTRVQFLRAAEQRFLRPPITVGGLAVASVEDITAMKLKAIIDCGELRDYYDLMEIDRRGVVMMEEGIALVLERYMVRDADQLVTTIVRALGYLGDVADDPALPATRSEIARYWSVRQPEVIANLARS
jgi:hypothetical protein